MNIIKVSVGLPCDVEYRGKMVSTGIFKTAVVGPVNVSFGNLQGDRQADLTVHGGRDKAIYAYPQEHYGAWCGDLDFDPGEESLFGENLTVQGMGEESVVIGTQFRVGTAVVTVTQPRIPCFKLGIRVGDSAFPARFLASGRLGFYLRVEEEGVLQAGDAFETVSVPRHGITLHKLWAMVCSDSDIRTGIDEVPCLLPHLDAGWLRRLRRVSDRTSAKPVR